MSLRIVLVETKHSGNVGSVARAMKNFGLSDLWLASPRCEIDRQAYSLASHAGDVLESARVVGDVAEALVGCTVVAGTTARLRASPGFRVMAPRQALFELSLDTSAVLFGPEDTGLSNRDLDLCQLALRIPTADYASLNLAQAVVVVAYEWFQARLEQGDAAGAGAPGGGAVPEPRASAAEDLEQRPATRERIEPMIEQFMETMTYIGYTEGPRAASVEHMFRRIFDKASLTVREVAALRGLWAQTKWAADQPPERIPGRRASR